MKKITFAILGMGNRGMAYASKQLKYPEEMEVTAICDPRRIRLDAANKYLKLPEERLFDSVEAILAQPRLADVMIVATPDAKHREHAIAAMEKGYHLLLEKPIANHPEEVAEIVKAAEKYDRKVIVCHVLRYTVFYREVKRIIDSGVLGKVENIIASEQIGYYHFAHSYVRGNWHNLAQSSPAILAKCSHDMDLMLWLTGKKCKKVSSFGSLDHFKAENCPEGATERCMDGCPVAEDCPFNAPRFYFGRCPGWPTHILHPEPTIENLTEVLKTSNYGRCVYKMDNDVVDHQVVNLLLEDGVTVNFTMSAFNDVQDRRIFVQGTRGEIQGDFRNNIVKVSIYDKESYEIDVSKMCDDFSGHGGGDAGLIYDVIRYFRGDDFDASSITTIDRSAESHFVAFAAEESRLAEGAPVDPAKFAN